MWRGPVSVAIFCACTLVGHTCAQGSTGALQKEDNKPTLAEVVLLQAWYGDPTSTGADVTATVKSAFVRGDAIQVSASLFTDTASGHHKLLWIRYRLRGAERAVYAPDDKTFFFSSMLDDAPKPGTYQLISASYHGVDVTKQVRNLLAQGVSSIPVVNSALGVSDPAVGERKTLSLTFKLAEGDLKVLSGDDGNSISLKGLLPLKELPELTNGTFESTDTSSFSSQQEYVPAGESVLSKPGTFTISEGILRPFQLEPSIRADFVEHTGRPGSMAMWISPVRGRQPVLLWEEKVAVQPDTDYTFSCSASDISDSDVLFATIVLDVDGARSKPYLIQDVFKWHDIRMKLHTGGTKSVHLKIWRDVLPYGADGAAALGLDDIQFWHSNATAK